jgi:PST family polysaccharide transporter
MILARIISPEEYGIVAVLIVFMNFFNLFADMGIGISVIQHPEMNEENHGILFSFSIFLGVSLLILMCALAYPISVLYSNEEYIKMFPLISIAALFNSLNIIPNALLIRDKKFNIIAMRTILCAVGPGIVAVGLALAGFGPYALIIQSISSSIFLFIWNYTKYPIKPVRHSISRVETLLGKYSGFQFIFNIINYFTRNLDNLVIGAIMGNAALGYYDKAYRLTLYPNQLFTSVITGVLHPYVRDYKNNYNELTAKLEKILKITSIIGIFIMIVCYWCSSEIILILFGSNWTQAAGLFKILSISIWAQMLSSFAGSVFLGIGRTDQTFKCGIINLVLIVIAIILGVVNNSLQIVSIGVGIAYNIIFVSTYYILVSGTMNSNFISFIKIFFGDIFFAFGFIIVVSIMPELSLGLFESLLIKLGTCSILYFFYLVLSKQLSILTGFFTKAYEKKD